ncbi:MAG: hypothetical protein CME40_04205 [Haliea sp.]|nr:hypothetical protein [Haliea sp.]|tara:strand:+ start:6980 stop:7987 length:1008 start_codon:yes stop_codon:yes gene_type:complete
MTLEQVGRVAAETRLIGESVAMQTLRQDLALVADSELTVLVAGETGTGKELVAQSVHEQSCRASAPFVRVNCAALSEGVLESELFGHERGAFTGASQRREGLFQRAHGGTLFLDEVGELTLSAQPKLLRALQCGEVQRVGSDAVHTVNVRVIAATNRDLEQEVAAGRFREDLYHRLSVYPLVVPPLRARDGDVIRLAEHFLRRQRCRCGVRDLRLADCARRALEAASWPGNVRELEHVIARGVLRASLRCQRRDGLEILAGDLFVAPPCRVDGPEDGGAELSFAGVSLREATDSFQAGLIRQTLRRHKGVRAAAARELGVDRGNFTRLLQRLQIS